MPIRRRSSVCSIAAALLFANSPGRSRGPAACGSNRPITYLCMYICMYSVCMHTDEQMRPSRCIPACTLAQGGWRLVSSIHKSEFWKSHSPVAGSATKKCAPCPSDYCTNDAQLRAHFLALASLPIYRHNPRINIAARTSRRILENLVPLPKDLTVGDWDGA